MTGESFEFSSVDFFTAGAIGEPGSRVFYLQARSGDATFTLKVEKQQVAALGEYLSELLEELPPTDPPVVIGGLDLEEPVVPAWIVGGLGVVFDNDSQLFVVVAEEMVPANNDDDDGDDHDDDDPDEQPHGTARVYLTREQVAVFAIRAEELMASGRPACIFCGNPINPDGHICVRMN